MAPKVRMINTFCYGCRQPMQFEAKPVVLVNMDGSVQTHYGKDDSVWICKTCRLEPAKLKAARVAAGMPATPSMPEEFDYDEEVA